jgi:hypothetical protein
MMADELEGAAGSDPPGAVAPPDSTAGLSQADLQARPDAGGGGEPPGQPGGGLQPADPNVAAAAAAGTQQSGGSPTIRDAAKFYGLDLSQYGDDAQAFAYLVQAARDAQSRNYYTELGQQIAPHAEAVQQYLREYQARQKEQKAPERKAWEAPEFDERWLQWCDRDPQTGRFIPKPGVNPLVADKVNDYADHIESWTTQLARNPREALSGLIEEVAGQLLESRFGAVAAQQEAQQIIAANEPWLYQVDQSGRRLVDAQGRFIPTPLGARYYTHLRTLQQAGVKDSRSLDALAKQLLQADMAAGTLQGASPPATTPQSGAAMGRPPVNPGQAVNPARRDLVPGATDPSEDGLSLAERMRRALAEEGVTDADFANVFA